MNEKEIGEIRRHLRRDRSNMTAIYGCFVNDNKEIISEPKPARMNIESITMNKNSCNFECFY